MKRENLLIAERMSEVTQMCDREHPIYEHVSSYGVALYVLGFFKCADMMSFDDLDAQEAGVALKEHFTEIRRDELPAHYRIAESKDQYLMVFGDPLFPVHFAVVTDAANERPYFSKLTFFGTGYDSLEELKGEFFGGGKLTDSDIHYFRRNPAPSRPISLTEKIYITKKNDAYTAHHEEGGYLVCEKIKYVKTKEKIACQLSGM